MSEWDHPSDEIVAEPNADECAKLLEGGWEILLFKNRLGSYSAVVKHPNEKKFDVDNERLITDDFTPSRVLHRITEKALFNRYVQWKADL